MYSPKIQENLIPRIYQVAERAKMPMTRWASQTLEWAIADQDASLNHPIALQHVTTVEMPP